MATLRVEVEQDHLERLVKKPLGGLIELLWNAVDADATTIEATLEVGQLGGLDAVVVRDNGTGITRERASMHFSHLGGSWKKTAKVSDAGRSLHGQAGQGRWAAYGLGDVVRWTSVAEQVTGELVELRIVGRRGRLTEFDVSEPTSVSAGTKTGTVVKVEQLNDAALRAVERDDVLQRLTTTFALALERYPVEMTWRGRRLDPAGVQRRRHTQELHVEGVEGTVELVIIEWSVPQLNRSLHLCDAAGASLHEMKPGIQAPGFDFTAYLRWDGFRDLATELVLEGELAQEPVTSLVEEAKEAMRTYFGDRARERGTELVASWKGDTSYPYSGEPATAVERAERNLFDIVAVSAAAAVENVDLRARKLSLRLMREALENSPASLHEVLREVLELPVEHVEELRSLLETTSLSEMITATRRITDRLDFLVGLEELVFDKEHRKNLLERQQLHRILAGETWVFREEYALTADDVTLRTALREHIQLLGREDLAPEEVEAAEVLDSEGRRVVVDLMLSRVVEQRRDHREHVVIELKRPNVHIGTEQIMQLTKYAQAAAADSRFAHTDTRWEFWIVGDAIDKSAELWLNQPNRDPDVIFESQQPRVTARAVT